MGKDTRVSLSILRTVNLGNYENIKIEAGIEETLEPGETYEEGYARLWGELKRELGLAKKYQVKELGSEPEEIGKPDISRSKFRRPTTVSDEGE